MFKIATMGKRIYHKFAHFVRRQFISIMTIRALEVAPSVDLRQNIVQSGVNQLRHRSRKLASIKKNRLVIPLEEAAFQPD